MLSARCVFEDAGHPWAGMADAGPRRTAEESDVYQQAEGDGEGEDEGQNHTAAYSIPIGIELIDFGNKPLNRP